MKEPRIVEITPKKLIGMRIVTSLAEDGTISMWKQFMPRRNEITNKVKDHKFYSVQVFDKNQKIESFTPQTKFEKWATVEVTSFGNIPDGMESLTLIGGLYAVFRYKGTVSNFPQTWLYIFKTWLPQSDFELDSREHFEILGEQYLGPNDPNSEEDVWIPIRRKRQTESRNN